MTASGYNQIDVVRDRCCTAIPIRVWLTPSPPSAGSTASCVRGGIARTCLRGYVLPCSVATSFPPLPGFASAFARSNRIVTPRLVSPTTGHNPATALRRKFNMTTKTMTATIGPKIKTALPGPNAKRVLAGDEKYISPSYTRSYPMVAKSGRGIVVEDIDGNEFFDFSAGIAVTSTGHCHPDVVAAIQKQAGELIHMSGTDFYYESMVTLAERLSKIAPMPGPHKFYYANSGTEAIEAALKLARYHTKRQNVIAFLGGFHGRTMGALSLTASKPQQKRRFAPLVPGVTHVRYPYAYRGCTGGPQEEEAFSLGCARYIEEKIFKTIVPPEEVAAIFVEPIQGEGGYVVAPTEFLQELRRICDRHGILLVAD